MPRPRIQVSLLPDAHDVVTEIAELSGRSRSAIVAEIVEGTLPALKASVKAIRSIRDLDAQQREEVLSSLDETEKKALHGLDALLGAMEQISGMGGAAAACGRAGDHARAGARGRSTVDLEGSRPPSINKGVRK